MHHSNLVACRPNAHPGRARRLSALGVLALLSGLAWGCVPEPSPPDGYAAPAGDLPVTVRELAVEARFVWPDEVAGAADDRIVVSDTAPLRLKVQIHNVGRSAAAVHLDDVVMRPVAGTGDEDDVEAVFGAPGELTLQPGEQRVLDFGEVTLFFGFVCRMHLSGEVVDAQRSDHRVAISHASPPLLLSF